MSQTQSTSSPLYPREQHGTHARLRAAINSLDLDLESEFVRFRQAKAGTFTQPSYDWPPHLSTSSETPVPQDPTPVVARTYEPETTAAERDWDPEREYSSPLSLSHESLSLPPFDLAAILKRSLEPELPADIKALPAADHTASNHYSDLSIDYLDSSEALRNGLTEVDLEVLRPRREKPGLSLRSAWALGAISVLASGGLALLAYAQRPAPPTNSNPPVAEASTQPSPTVSPSSMVLQGANLVPAEFQNISQMSLSVLQPMAAFSTNSPSLVRVVVAKADAAILSRVQQMVPSAFLEATAQGSRIQVGVFADLQRATTIVATLQKEGLAAQIER